MPNRRRFLQTACHFLVAPFWPAALARAATIVRYPYLQDQQNNRVTIRWTTLEPGTGVVEFSRDRSYSRSVMARAVAFTPLQTGMSFTYYRFTATLTGLNEGTQYYYRVLQDGTDLTHGEELTCQTSGSTPFEFLIFGDSGTASLGQAELARRMIREQPDLVLHTGDIVYPDGAFEAYQTKYFNYYRDLMKRLPFYPSPGNHDYNRNDLSAYLAVHALPTDQVHESDHGLYYSFDRGNVHFVSLDSNRPLLDSVTGRGKMLEWLDRDLEQSRQFWRIVYFHHPPYAAGPNQTDPLSALVRTHIVPILEKHRVPLVFSGHEHSYQRTLPLRRGEPGESDRATVYITTGGGGAQLYPVGDSPLIAAGESTHHFLTANVNGTRLTLRAIRSDGTEIDTVVLRPRPILTGSGVVNTASFTNAIAPGGLITIFGKQLASVDAQPSRLPAPLDMSGLSVRLNGQRLPLFYVSPTQVNAQLPFDALGEATIELVTLNGRDEIQVKIAETAPAIFSVPTESGPLPSVIHDNGELVSQAAPAEAGETLSVYLTGLGRVDGTVTPGQAAPTSRLIEAASEVTVLFGEIAVRPSFAGLAPGTAGIYQVNFQIPVSLRPGGYTLRVLADGVPSNQVRLDVWAA